MPALVTFEIGGVAFDIRCRDAQLSPPQERYRPFCGRRHPDADLIPVAVRNDPGAIPESGVPLFSVPAWRLFGDADHYHLGLDPSGTRERSEYLARFDREVSAVTIHCSGAFARSRAEPGAIANPFCYPLDQILTMYALARRRGVLVHASGVNLDGRGFIFAGRSGAGKSTLSRLFASSAGGAVLSDDRVAVRSWRQGHLFYGTPWAGTEGIAVNERLPLHGIVFIRHGAENRLRPLDPAEALRRLFAVASIPWYDAPAMAQVLDVCEGLVAGVPACELHFRPEPQTVDYFRSHPWHRTVP